MGTPLVLKTICHLCGCEVRFVEDAAVKDARVVHNQSCTGATGATGAYLYGEDGEPTGWFYEVEEGNL